jgi:hypothetical protein
MTMAETQWRLAVPLQDILRAAMDRIIPSDDYPSASENGVMTYLLRQLEGDMAPLAAYYEIGLVTLDAEALAVCGAPFAALDADRQDAILTRIAEDETATPWMIDPPQFFERLIQHVSEGYYANPGNGANLDKVSWRMIGFADRSGLEEAR